MVKVVLGTTKDVGIKTMCLIHSVCDVAHHVGITEEHFSYKTVQKRIYFQLSNSC